MGIKKVGLLADLLAVKRAVRRAKLLAVWKAAQLDPQMGEMMVVLTVGRWELQKAAW